VIGPEKPVLVGPALSVLPWVENPAIPAPASVLEALKIRGDISDKGTVRCTYILLSLLKKLHC